MLLNCMQIILNERFLILYSVSYPLISLCRVDITTTETCMSFVYFSFTTEKFIYFSKHQ